MQRFNKDIMKIATYYETLNYVADYVQNFLSQILEQEIQIPVSIDRLLEKLKVPVKNRELYQDSLAFIEFKEEACIWISDKVSSNSNLDHWLKLKCLSYYILNNEIIIDKITDRKRLMLYNHVEYTIEVPQEDGELLDMIAYEIMVPWKQSMIYFLENSDFFEKLDETKLGNVSFGERYEENAIRYAYISVGSCIKMQYASYERTCAYNHLIKVLEAKFFLGSLNSIEQEQYREIQKKMYEINKKIYKIKKVFN